MPTPNGVWCNEFMPDYAKAVLQGITNIPRFLSVYTRPTGLGPGVVLATLGPDDSVRQDVATSWTFAPMGNVEQANLSVVLTFPPSYTGNIYYGIVLYTSDAKAAWFAPFGTPFVVLAGGSTLTVVPQLGFKDCAS